MPFKRDKCTSSIYQERVKHLRMKVTQHSMWLSATILGLEMRQSVMRWDFAAAEEAFKTSAGGQHYQEDICTFLCKKQNVLFLEMSVCKIYFGFSDICEK